MEKVEFVLSKTEEMFSLQNYDNYSQKGEETFVHLTGLDKCHTIK